MMCLKLNSDTSEEFLFCIFVLQETFSTIGDPATAMRDPMFYRLHSFVDDMFQEHKSTLPHYDVNRVSDRHCCIIHDPYSGSTSFDIQNDCRWIQDFSSIYPICAYNSLFFLPTYYLNFSFCHHFFLCNLLLLVISIILVVIVIIVIIIMSLLMN